MQCRCWSFRTWYVSLPRLCCVSHGGFKQILGMEGNSSEYCVIAKFATVNAPWEWMFPIDVQVTWSKVKVKLLVWILSAVYPIPYESSYESRSYYQQQTIEMHHLKKLLLILPSNQADKTLTSIYFVEPPIWNFMHTCICNPFFAPGGFMFFKHVLLYLGVHMIGSNSGFRQYCKPVFASCLVLDNTPGLVSLVMAPRSLCLTPPLFWTGIATEMSVGGCGGDSLRQTYEKPENGRERRRRRTGIWKRNDRHGNPSSRRRFHTSVSRNQDWYQKHD